MFLKIKTIKGHKYAYLVSTYRENGTVKQRQHMYFGRVEDKSIPYLKAAFAKNQPKIVYDDGTVYDPKAS